jgi:hypothetical protein
LNFNLKINIKIKYQLNYMNSVIKPVENSNYCLINDILKVSISSALLLARLKNIKSDNFFF